MMPRIHLRMHTPNCKCNDDVEYRRLNQRCTCRAAPELHCSLYLALGAVIRIIQLYHPHRSSRILPRGCRIHRVRIFSEDVGSPDPHLCRNGIAHVAGSRLASTIPTRQLLSTSLIPTISSIISKCHLAVGTTIFGTLYSIVLSLGRLTISFDFVV